jgi:hypothetical protein
MRPAAPLRRALCLLLAVSALLPAFAGAQAPCATVPAAAGGCCCEEPAPAPPPCHGEATEAATASACACDTQPAPAAPAERAPAASHDQLAPCAPPAVPAADATTPCLAGFRAAPDAPRAGGCALLRLHCVILI